MKFRRAFQTLLNERDKPRVTVLIGPRQVGKSTLLRALQKELGGPLFDIDIFSNFDKLSTYERFIATLQLAGYDPRQASRFFVFLDEFQRYPDLSRVLKNVYDHHANIKIYATGSSSLAIKDAIQESLAGRKTITHLYPLSFEEFLAFKDREDLHAKAVELAGLTTDDYSALVPELLALFQEFLVYGGYPEVVLAPAKDRPEVFSSIFDLYVKKDLVEYLKVDKLRNAKVLIEQLALNHGGIANYSAYGQASDLDTKTAKSYIEILTETFLVLPLRPFYRNKNREIVKAPKVYFVDNGVRNFFINNFNDVRLRADAGELFESYVLGELLKNGEDPETFRYWRTKDGKEVDLVIDKVSRQIAVEMKHKTRLKAGDTLGLRHFLDAYKAERAFLVSLGELGADPPLAKVDAFNVARVLAGV